MMSSSLFDTMEEFSLQQGNYLDETYELSADIFSAELDTDGSILGLGLGPTGVDKQSSMHQPADESLEDLLLPGSDGDSFGEEWMETVDLSSLLGSTTTEPALFKVEELQPAKPVVTVTESKPEPRKEGMKAAAFELLKALLTQEAPVANLATDTSPPVSPEAIVPDLSIFTESFVGNTSLMDICGQLC